LGFYVAQSGSSLRTFSDILLVPKHW